MKFHSVLSFLKNCTGGTLLPKSVFCKKTLYLTVFAAFVLIAFQPVWAVGTSQSAAMLSGESYIAARQILKSIKKDDWQRARTAAERSAHPVAMKLFNWMYYTKKAGPIDFENITGFIKANPDWPRQGTLRLNAEQALTKDDKAYSIVQWFNKYPPITPGAMERYADALIELGMDVDLYDTMQTWWADTLLSSDQQAYFLNKYKIYLDEKAHKKRLDKQLFSEHYTNARAIAKILGPEYVRLAEARIAVREDKPGVDRQVAAVSDELQNDPGLLYERIRWRRRHNQDFGAIEMLHKAQSMETIPDPELLWKERHIIIRRLIENKQYESAYLLASKHIQTEGLGFAQAEFLAGWLALRFLEQPDKAFLHFEKLYNNVSTPISRARGAYWAGRASADLGYPEIAQKWYQVAARHQTAFYGQLAAGALEGEYRLPAQKPPRIDIAHEAGFHAKEMVQVAKLLGHMGFRRETSDFLKALSDEVETPEDYLLVADLSRSLDHYHNAIRIAKKGLNKDIFLMDHAYPTILGRLKDIDAEWALVHAIIRQESAFDFAARSPAGAMGLMQIMPATALDVARTLKVSHSTTKLVNDPNYNIRLGSSYIQSMIKRFDGSYVLALAAYNAGPGRVNQWLKTYGDPTKGEISMIDWIELIPIYETRNYVQRVLEGVYVYRLKLKSIQKDMSPQLHVAMTNGKL